MSNRDNSLEITTNLNKFVDFLDQNYKTELLETASNNIHYIHISFKKIIEFDYLLGDYILSDFEVALGCISHAAAKIVSDEGWNAPKVRLTDINVGSLRKDIWKLRSEEVSKFVILKGFIRRIAEVNHYINSIRITCNDCAKVFSVYMKEFYSDPTSKGKRCTECGGRMHISHRELRDIQRLVVEEDPMYIKAQQKPRSIMIELHDDLCREEIDKTLQLSKTVIVSGIVKDKRIKPASTECRKFIEANMINVVEENLMNIPLTNAEITEFEEFSKKEEALGILAQSIVPNIQGHENAKLAALLQLAGGVALFKDGLLEERGCIHVLLVGSPGQGKCLKKGTKVLMFDGSIKKVEEVIIGDLLMGDDSTPRKVLSLASGTDQMYKAVPIKGNSFSFNSEHILTLKRSEDRPHVKALRTYGTDKIIDIPLKAYMDLNVTDKTKERYKLFKVPVEFPKKEIDSLLPPYLLGVWLGDGTNKQPCISNPDIEIIEYLKEYSSKNDFRLSKIVDHPSKCPSWRICHTRKEKRGRHYINHFWEKIKSYNLNENKHIPLDYKINSRETRLELLAGLIDTDGYYFDNCYEIVTKYPQLRDDILFLCRSVGLAANSIEKKGTIKSINFEGVYQRIHIYGDLSMVPCKVKRKQGHKRLQIKDPLVTGFKIEPDGIGEYYGFELDGNRRYLLDDFTVAHNSVILKRSIMFMPGSIFTGGKLSSGVGLVASVAKDEELGGWVCDAGAVPRASGAICAIDEVDKISKEDIAHLNNAMIDMKVRVDKAGVHTTLETLTSILAAANPTNRIFDRSEPIWKQIGLPKDFIDRFDLIFPIVSGTNEVEQRKVADLVVGKYRTDSLSAKAIKPHLWVMKFLSHAKKFEPGMTEEVQKCIVDNFVNIAKPADKQEDSAYFSYRLLTNIIRLTQAVAKLKLRNECTIEDAQISINLLLSSLKAQDIITKDGLMDYFRAEAIIPKKKRDIFKFIKDMIDKLSKESLDGLADGISLVEKAAEFEISPDELDDFLESLKKKGDLFEPKPNKFKLQ